MEGKKNCAGRVWHTHQPSWAANKEVLVPSCHTDNKLNDRQSVQCASHHDSPVDKGPKKRSPSGREKKINLHLAIHLPPPPQLPGQQHQYQKTMNSPPPPGRDSTRATRNDPKACEADHLSSLNTPRATQSARACPEAKASPSAHSASKQSQMLKVQDHEAASQQCSHV
jgi:hypothetical protein